MENLIFSLNATLPVFITIFIGYILKRIGMLNEGFVSAANKFNFKVTLPLLLFTDLASTDIKNNFDLKYVLFCAAVTLVMICVIWCLSRRFIKDKSIVGAFVQASYRSSAAVLGVSFIQNIYGTSGMAPIMILGCVPLFNIFAVLVLTIEGQNNGSGIEALKKSAINIVKNPIIISIGLGVIASILNINFGSIAEKTMHNFAVMATPLALVAIGAGFEGRKAIKRIKPTIAASVIKTILLPAIFIPAAIFFGFRDQALVALVIMLGSPTTPSSYIMAKGMNNDGVLTSSTVVMTTLLSAFTLTLWIYLVRCGGYIA